MQVIYAGDFRFHDYHQGRTVAPRRSWPSPLHAQFWCFGWQTIPNEATVKISTSERPQDEVLSVAPAKRRII